MGKRWRTMARDIHAVIVKELRCGCISDNCFPRLVWLATLYDTLNYKMVGNRELTMPAVKYGIFIENTFISHILQALAMVNHFLSDLITITATSCASSYLHCAQTVVTRMPSQAKATKCWGGAQWIKYSACKHEESRNEVLKNVGTVACIYNPISGQWETSRSLGPHWPVGLAYFAGYRPESEPISKNKINKTPRDDSQGCHLCKCIYTNTHIHTSR